MRIIIQLVGYIENDEDDRYVYQYSCNIVSVFNFNILKLFFHKYQHIITDDELNNCSLTCNTKNLKKDYLIDNNTLLDDNIVYKVFIFTSVQAIKDKLIQIFKMDGFKVSLNSMLRKAPDYDNNHFSHTPRRIFSNTDQENDFRYTPRRMFGNTYQENDFRYTPQRMFGNTYLENDLKRIDSDDDMSKNASDDETLKKLEEIDSEDEIEAPPIEDTDPTQIKQQLDLFKDPDFITLLRIFKNREELFNDFYKYINSSQIIKFTKLINEVDLNNNINFIKELNLNFQEEHIEEALHNTGNHINLAIRSLLHNV